MNVLEDVLKIDSLEFHCDVTRNHIRNMAAKYPTATTASIGNYLTRINKQPEENLSFKRKVEMSLQELQERVVTPHRRRVQGSVVAWREGVINHFAELIIKFNKKVK